MYWSAAMALKTPVSRGEQRANYGSFASGTRSSSGGNLVCIPEHQCLLHFTSPRMQHCEEQKLAEYHEREQSYARRSDDDLTYATTTTVKITASSALRMLLLSGKSLEKYVSISLVFTKQPCGTRT